MRKRQSEDSESFPGHTFKGQNESLMEAGNQSLTQDPNDMSVPNYSMLPLSFMPLDYSVHSMRKGNSSKSACET